MNSSGKRGIELSKNEERVNTRSFVKLRAPEIQVIDRSDIDRVGGIDQSKKPMIKKELQRGNVFHQVQKSGNNPERIIASDKASPTILAHEIGHHIERKLHPEHESKLSREINAWKDAPMVNNKINSKIKLDLLRSYMEKNAMSIPLLLKARNASVIKGLDAAKIDSKHVMAKTHRQANLFYDRVMKQINKNIKS